MARYNGINSGDYLYSPIHIKVKKCQKKCKFTLCITANLLGSFDKFWNIYIINWIFHGCISAILTCIALFSFFRAWLWTVWRSPWHACLKAARLTWPCLGLGASRVWGSWTLTRMWSGQTRTCWFSTRSWGKRGCSCRWVQSSFHHYMSHELTHLFIFLANCLFYHRAPWTTLLAGATKKTWDDLTPSFVTLCTVCSLSLLFISLGETWVLNNGRCLPHSWQNEVTLPPATTCL